MALVVHVDKENKVRLRKYSFKVQFYSTIRKLQYENTVNQTLKTIT